MRWLTNAMIGTAGVESSFREYRLDLGPQDRAGHNTVDDERGSAKPGRVSGRVFHLLSSLFR